MVGINYGSVTPALDILAPRIRKRGRQSGASLLIARGDSIRLCIERGSTHPSRREQHAQLWNARREVKPIECA